VRGHWPFGGKSKRWSPRIGRLLWVYEARWPDSGFGDRFSFTLFHIPGEFLDGFEYFERYSWILSLG